MSSESYDFGQVFQDVYVSKQKPAPQAVAESMKASLQSYPPLGQVTPISAEEVALTAILEIPKSRASEVPLEVSAWHSVDGAEWKDIALDPIHDYNAPNALLLTPESVSHHYFRSTVSFNQSLRFTLKFKYGSEEQWRWIRDEQGLDDGLIVNTAAEKSSNDLSDLIPDLNLSEWTVSSRLSQAPRSALWQLETTVSSAVGDDSAYRDVSIGTPWGSFSR